MSSAASVAAPPSEGGLNMLDGSQISDALAHNDDDLMQRLFQEALPSEDHDGCISVAQFRAVASSHVSHLLCGFELPASIFDQAFKSLQFPEDVALRIDEATFSSKLHGLMKAIADALHEEPLVVSVLDGSILKSLLEDEDEFAMLAENLFTELDENDTGKVDPTKLHTALIRMGLEMGVPIPSGESEEDLLVNALKKYTHNGDQNIGQVQFANLLQRILEDLASSLGAKPRCVMLSLKVNNGYQLKKLLDDPELVSKTADALFEEFDVSKNGTLDRAELGQFMEQKGKQLGLPPRESSELVGQLYDDLFSVSDKDCSGEVDKDEFRLLFQRILESFVVQLEFNPTFVSSGAVAEVASE